MQYMLRRVPVYSNADQKLKKWSQIDWCVSRWLNRCDAGSHFLNDFVCYRAKRKHVAHKIGDSWEKAVWTWKVQETILRRKRGWETSIKSSPYPMKVESRSLGEMRAWNRTYLSALPKLKGNPGGLCMGRDLRNE